MTEKWNWQDAIAYRLQQEIIREIEYSSLPKQLLMKQYENDLHQAICRNQKTFMIEMKIDMLQLYIETENNKIK